MKRIGILTSGGDCQALNATMRGVVKGLYNLGEEICIYGFLDGYKGLMYEKYRILKESDFSGILTKGGTILGTSRQPFKRMRIIEDGFDKVEAMKNTYRKLKLDVLVVLGGNGSIKSANMLAEEGLNVIALPKTIDNDIWGTDRTFGFQSAVDIATQAIDCIHTTAESHSRVFIVELMGHKVGWVALHAGIAGGADIILLPEIPYDIQKVCAALERREKQGKRFSILAVAEGAVSKDIAELPKKEKKQYMKKYPSAAYVVAEEIQNLKQQEVRVTVPGHTQRGGIPCPYDRVLSSRLGAKAAQLIRQEDYGKLVVFKETAVSAIPLAESAGKLKTVPMDSSILENARDLGICFGD